MRKIISLFLLFPIIGFAQTWEQIVIAPGSDTSNPMFFTEYNNQLYFSARGTSVSGIGRELYKTDGTQAGTGLVMDLNPNYSGSSSDPSNFTVFNGELYFTAEDGVHGRELFKTDGTTIHLVKDIHVGTGFSTNHSGNMMAMYEADGALYFFAEDLPGEGYDLWKTDGTEQGTVKVLELNTNESSGLKLRFKKLGNLLCFVKNDQNTNHNEIYAYNPTTNTATSVLDAYPSNNTSGYGYFTLFDNKLFVVADKLYYTDGTTTNSVALGATGITAFDKLTVLNNELFFFGKSATYGNQDLYKCYYSLSEHDYKVELVYNFNAGGSNFLNPIGILTDVGTEILIGLNNKLYFAAREQTSPNGGVVYQIYETDGTTTQVAIPVTYSGSPTSRSIHPITPFGNKLYFQMSGDNSPKQLWEANPSDATFTQLTSDTGPPTQPREIFPRPMKVWNNSLYLEGNTLAEGYELWKFTADELSTANESIEVRVGVHPNPFTTFITLNVENITDFTVSVHNIAGQSVKFDIQNNRINFGILPQGIYYLTLLNKTTNKQFTEKIIRK
ncbi:MAG: T9SS type A sorting domain-containing protein [Paludibacteraceae bacterium]